MNILKIVLLALFAVVAIVIVRQVKSEFALVLTVCTSVLLAVVVCDSLFDVVYTFYQLSETSGVDSQALSCVIKVVGIGYLAEFANNICVDANCKSVGDKVMLAAKISILFCALPIVQKLFAFIQGLVL